MADQNITELPIKTNSGVANTDYMLGIDASEGYQILVRDVAKYIMENYNGSTLAGSAQTPKSALDALNSKMFTTLGTAITDPNTVTTPGSYRITDMSAASNVPTDVTWTSSNNAELWVFPRAIDTRVFQCMYVYNPSGGVFVYNRVQNGANTFTSWQRNATKDAVDALNSNTSVPSITTLADLYSAGTSLASTHITKFVVINSDVTTALTNGQVVGACRGFITKADTNIVDVFMYGIASEKMFIARLTGASTVSKCVIQPTRTEVDTLNSKINGISIEQNSDLNNFTTLGRYYTDSGSTTATITNKPANLSSAFTLDVMTRGGYVNQIIYDYGGKIYMRGKISSGWYNWYVFTGTSVS